MAEPWQAVRRRLPPCGRAALLGATLMLALAGCGGKAAAPGTTTAPTTSTASTTSCDTYGPTWVRGYNKKAIAQGNPIRMLSACCQAGGQLGVHHCFIKLTLAGTNDLGCESVDIGTDGLPAGQGKHEKCNVDT